LREYRVNPVLYVEFEDINGANKSLLEVVGNDGNQDLTASNAEGRAEKQREAELKLILSSNARGWNFAENAIAEKNLGHAAWEFGYALAASRPLRLSGGAHAGSFAAENFSAGAEMYGGLGTRNSFGLRDTSHYAGPVANWSGPNGWTLSGSVGFGLNGNSVSRLYRFGVAYELGQLGRYLKRGAR
ncbi:MAG: hypothetical protein KGK08_14210, partial [Acidobacteriota bacterium]|nr:hypothetical protein [Acidobacteriota bacterium]